MKWYESDEPSTQPLVVALPSQPRIEVDDALRRRLTSLYDAVYEVFMDDLNRKIYSE